VYKEVDIMPNNGRPYKSTKEQREEIDRLMQEGMKLSQIVALTGIPRTLVHSQVYREKRLLKYKSGAEKFSTLKVTDPEKYQRLLKRAREYQRNRKLGMKKSETKDEPKETILPAPKTAREIKGLEIADNCKIIKRGSERIVPSQSSRSNYIVKLNTRKGIPFRSCTCPDFESTRNCKHIFAVMYSEMDYEKPKVEIMNEPKKIYQQNWGAYNEAQTHEKDLFLKLMTDLCQNIGNHSVKGNGRDRLPLKDMVFSSALKVYTTYSLRRFASDMRSAVQKGCICKMCSYSTVSNYMRDVELTPVLHNLIELTALPLKTVEERFAVDSTGFRTTTFSDYCREKHDTKQENEWVKCHLMCGVKTNIVTAVEIGFEHHSADSPQFIPLVERTVNSGFKINEVSADKAYSSRKNLNYVDEIGGKAYIPYKSSATGRSGGDRLWHKMFKYFTFNRDEFMQHYHQRSNIETTNYMIKSKFTDFVRSRDKTAQINEVLLKVLCHNIVVLIHEMHELGIEPNFLNEDADR
jgi:transposase